ncbi:hypothetical protein T492DRAFT_944035 [Pavlovales sp. CCMP2436]|nr:hypothetical protein T492DRAFT_944035 [Pavlovales sp. CCMP2436]
MARRAAFEPESDDDDAASTDELTNTVASRRGDRSHGGSGGGGVLELVRRNWVALAAGVCVLVTLGLITGVPTARKTDSLKLVSWNIAAINNNPFEYWITHDEAEYKKLMRDVQGCIDNPGHAGDVPVAAVFTPEMVAELKLLMNAEGWVDLDVSSDYFATVYGDKPIISGFIRDGELGKKRLVSMPDRLTNTINLQGGGLAHRPTVINCYDKSFRDKADWWTQWKVFVFAKKLTLASGKSVRPVELIGPISRAKYPALTVMEAGISKPLSTIALAAFDAILVHVLDTCAGGRHASKWQPLRAQMCAALNSKKDARIAQILGSSLYRDADVIFLQEVAMAFVQTLRSSPMGAEFDVRLASTSDGKRDQNSAILVRKSCFNVSSAVDRTAAFDTILAKAGKDVPVAPGDVIALSVAGMPTAPGKPPAKFLLASFHGDTNGLATVAVVKAMSELAGTPALAGHVLLFGLDANTYEHGSSHKQGVLEFADEYGKLGLSSCWGDRPDPTNHTTFNARTYLQPQLNKAVKLSDLDKPDVGDKNPKDFILFPRGGFAVVRTTKDNTGSGQYLENTVFPTLAFPSDHGLLATVIKPTPV